MPPRFKPGGVGQYFEGGQWDGAVREVHTKHCSHCRTMVEFPTLKSMMEYMDFCRLCMAPICLSCYGKPCTPTQKRIEAAEERHYRSQQFAKALGMDRE